MTAAPDETSPKVKARFRIGTSGWVYPHWKGTFYPAELPQNHWFEYYCTQFDTVEINATFYRWFKPEAFDHWYAQAPPGFVYVLKVPSTITHRKRLVNVEDLIDDFCRRASRLREKLGLLLMQLPPRIRYDPERLRRALLAFHDPRRVAVEFRSRDWQGEEIRCLLAEVGAVYCAVDSPEERPREWVTSEAAYIRLHGRGGWYASNYGEIELQEIAGVARRLTARGAREVYIFFNNDYQGFAPANARRLREILV